MSSRIDLKTPLRRKVPLSRYTTMQVGGEAEYFAEPASEEELTELLEFAQQENLPVHLLGKGSNTIFRDEGFAGLVITMIHFAQEKIEFHRELPLVSVSAGVHLYRLALASRDHGLGGVEFVASIPGTVGGALAMNAGFSRWPGQKNEIGDLVEQVVAMDFQGKKEILNKPDLKFSYRQSNLRDKIILEATLRLWRRPSEAIEKEIRANFKYRNREQDVRYPSSGSIFKNPSEGKLTAGQLIERLGMKGLEVGGAMISKEHANYMINLGHARGRDFIELIAKVQKAVWDATGIELETEVLVV